jgi:hypothetical protein
VVEDEKIIVEAGEMFSLIILMAISGGISIYYLKDIDDSSNSLQTQMLPLMLKTNRLAINDGLKVAAMRGYLITGKDTYIDDASSIPDVAAGSTEQMNAANETSAVVEQMSAGIQQIAANSNQVASQSAQAADRATEGGKSVDKAVSQFQPGVGATGTGFAGSGDQVPHLTGLRRYKLWPKNNWFYFVWGMRNMQYP